MQNLQRSEEAYSLMQETLPEMAKNQHFLDN